MQIHVRYYKHRYFVVRTEVALSVAVPLGLTLVEILGQMVICCPLKFHYPANNMMWGPLSLEDESITELAEDLLKNNSSTTSFSPVNSRQL